MAHYKKVEISDGFMRGTKVGASVQIGTSVNLKVKMKLKAKTVSNIFDELSKHKRDFHADTWKQIEGYHASGGASFFHRLFGMSVEGGYDYENQITEDNIKANKEAQTITKAFNDAEETEVCRFYRCMHHFFYNNYVFHNR